MTDLSFKVATRRREPVTFELGGDDHVYSFLAPKQAEMILPILDTDGSELDAARASFKWLDNGLSESDRKRIEMRLRDKADNLDFDTLSEVVRGLMEFVSGRPTS